MGAESGEFLDPVLCRQGRVIGRAAGDEVHGRAAVVSGGQIDGQHSRPVGADASGEKLAESIWLLVNFLDHVMAVGTEIENHMFQGALPGGPLDRAGGRVLNAGFLQGDGRDVAVLEIGNILGERGKGDGVRGNQGAVFAVADDQRRAAAGGDQQAGGIAEGKDKCRSPPRLADSGAHGLRRVGPFRERRIHQMQHGLGVGLAGKDPLGRGQLPVKAAVILDNAVMDQGGPLGAMRMCVCFHRCAMGCPARMADAGVSGERGVLEPGFQIVELADRPEAIETGLRCHGDAGRIVSAVFQPSQAGLQMGDNIFRGNAGDDSAHRPSGSSAAAATGQPIPAVPAVARARVRGHPPPHPG